MLGTITREQLVLATELTLERAARHRVEVSDGLAEQVRGVARTATRITPLWWVEEYQCGCLIGTLLGPDAVFILEQKANAQRASFLPEDEVACCFPGALSQVIGVSSADAYAVIDR